MSTISKITDFISKHADLAVNIFHMMKSGKAEHQILEEIKKTGNLSEKQAEVIGAMIKELDKKGFEDEIRNALGAMQLGEEDFFKWGQLLGYIYDTDGEEERDNIVLCMASISDPKLRSQLILTILSNSHINGEFSLERGRTLVRQYSMTTEPTDPFALQVDKINKIIDGLESDLHRFLSGIKEEAQKLNQPLDKVDNWLSERKRKREERKRRN